MNFQNLPMGLIIFVLGQTATAAWAIITMFFDLKSLKAKLIEVEAENKELKEQIKIMSDMLLVVKNNTDLLLLGRIKTGGK